MSGSLRILTWNVQLRSIAMEVLDRVTFEFEYSAQIFARSTEIVKRLNNHTQDYDIICFNEVFDEIARKILLDGLKNKYPYYVEKADASFLSRSDRAIRSLHEEKYWLKMDPMFSRYEDSGLMFFSRYPFAMDQFNFPPEFLLGSQLPAIYFGWYALSDDNDSKATKGLLGVRLLLPGGEQLKVFVTHLQADENDDGEHHYTRSTQLSLIQEMDAITSANAVQPVGGKYDIVMVGDLNIQGMSSEQVDFESEWKSRFSHQGGDVPLWDSWVYEQSPGYTVHTLPSLTGPANHYPSDPGDSAITKQPVAERRFDYCLLKPHSPKRRRKVQHLFIDHALMRPGTTINYLSDHYPLGIDLHLEDSTATNTLTADKIAFASTPLGPLCSKTTELGEGIVHWFRLDEEGTFDFFPGDRQFRMELFGGDNLSDPLVPYQVFSSKPLGFGRNGLYAEKFVLPLPPVFIKISGVNRHISGSFSFFIRAYTGLSPDDAIVVVKQIVKAGHMKPNGITSVSQSVFDNGESTADALFYCFDLAAGLRQQIDISFTPDAGAAPLRIALCKYDAALKKLEIIQVSRFSDQPTRLQQALDDGNWHLVVQRQPGNLAPAGFSMKWDSNVTILLPEKIKTEKDGKPNPLAPCKPGRATVFCVDDTTGWGADDIYFSISADGKEIVPKTFLGGMNSGQPREIIAWIQQPVYFVNLLQVHLTEEDTVDGDDRKTFDIPAIKIASGTTLDYKKELAFDGGRYRVTCRLA